MKKIVAEWKNTVFIFLGIFLLALSLRVYNLGSFPVFADEAIYIRWAQVMRSEPTLRFLPLSDGKQPLFMWVVIPFLKIFSDPLVAGRFVSVMTGLGTLLGIFIFSFLLFKSKKASLVASFLYAISPFAIFFDRMALVDSMLAMFGLWYFIFVYLTATHRRLDTAMLAGFALGGAMLTKSPAIFFLILSPVFLIFSLDKSKLKNGFIFLSLLLISATIGYGFYNILRLGPNFHLLTSRTQDYVYPISHLWTSPLDPFKPYFDRILRWISALGPATLYAFIAISILSFYKKYFKQIFVLLLMFLFPAMVVAMFTKAITARYVLYTITPLYILAGLAFVKLNNKKIKIILTGLLLINIVISINFSYYLLAKPLEAKLPEAERAGYLVEWSSGIGIKEVAERLIEIRNNNPESNIVVGTEGYFGTLPDGLQIYLEKEPNITVIGIGQNISEIPISLVESREAGNLTFLVANSSRLLVKPDEFDEIGLEVNLNCINSIFDDFAENRPI